MKVDPKMYIEIYGHTDNAGDENKNLELSIKRAAAVGNYLIAKGVGKEQFIKDLLRKKNLLVHNIVIENQNIAELIQFQQFGLYVLNYFFHSQ